MANGKPGDHPLTDIVNYNANVYSGKAADLIREIVKLSDDKARRGLGNLLWEEYHPLNHPNVQKLEAYLLDLRDTLLKEAKDRGFEINP